MASNPNQQMSSVRLYRIAHGRTGDKGDRSNISVIADRPEFYEAILAQVTIDCVRRVFQHRRPGKISRYELPRIHALNFVLDAVLDGGVNDALNLDSHGKGLAGFLLDVEIMVPTALLAAEVA